MKNKSNYRFVFIIDHDAPKRVLGRGIILPKYPKTKFFIHRYRGRWRISEALSGLMVIEGDNRTKELIKLAQEKFDGVIPSQYPTIDKMIEAHLKEYNIEPLTENIKILEGNLVLTIKPLNNENNCDN